MALWSWTLALIVALVSRLAQAQDRPALVFTAMPDQDESRLIERFTKVAESLSGILLFSDRAYGASGEWKPSAGRRAPSRCGTPRPWPADGSGSAKLWCVRLPPEQCCQDACAS